MFSKSIAVCLGLLVPMLVIGACSPEDRSQSVAKEFEKRTPITGAGFVVSAVTVSDAKEGESEGSGRESSFAGKESDTKYTGVRVESGLDESGVKYTGDEVSFDVDERVFFVEPQEGAEVTSPVRVVMGTEGLIVRRRFEPQKRYGHHHIFVNQSDLPAYGEEIPMDDAHIHYHNIEKEIFLDLPPGQHTLTLLFGNAHDKPYEFHGREVQEHPVAIKRGGSSGTQDLPPLTDTVTVTVTGSQKIFFIEPSDPDVRKFPFIMKVGSEGLDISKGHFVVVWNVYPFPKEGQPVLVDDNHSHFETGATELEMDPKAGGHKITLLFVDHNNKLLPGPPLSDKMDIAIWKPVGKLEAMARDSTP